MNSFLKVIYTFHLFVLVLTYYAIFHGYHTKVSNRTALLSKCRGITKVLSVFPSRHDLRKPFDFTSALQFMAKLLKTNSRTSLYSKLLVCFPGSKKSSPVNSFDVDVIKDKFKSTDFESDGREGSNSIVRISEFYSFVLSYHWLYFISLLKFCRLELFCS